MLLPPLRWLLTASGGRVGTRNGGGGLLQAKQQAGRGVAAFLFFLPSMHKLLSLHNEVQSVCG